MRVSTFPGDAGFVAVADRRNVTVYLDGVEQRDVVMADSDTGEVVRCMRDAAGNLLVEDDKVRTERLVGRVSIVRGTL